MNDTFRFRYGNAVARCCVRQRAGLRGLLAACLAGISLSLFALSASATNSYSSNGNCVEAIFVVPLGITQLHVTAEGDQGGTGGADGPPHNGVGGKGGFGSKVVTTIPVTPGAKLYVNVADAYAQTQPTAGGYGGGPGGSTQDGPVNVGGQGGASSWIANADPGASCTPAPSSLLVLAAGGGGGGGSASFLGTNGNGGGAGGTEIDSGGHGIDGGSNTQNDGAGGSGASSSSAGLGGAAGHNSSCRNGVQGANGSQLQGGFGGDGGSDPGRGGCQGATTASGSGGGGGGGYFGGGGGGGGSDSSQGGQAHGGGGGAGSSFVMAGASGTTISHATSSLDRNIDPPVIIITPADTAPLIISGDTYVFTQGTSVSVTLQATGYPLPTTSIVGSAFIISGLPNGISQQDNGDGTVTLSGTPLGLAGTSSGSAMAQNTDSGGNVHQVTQTLFFTVQNGPQFSFPTSVDNFAVGTPASHPISVCCAYPAPTFSTSGTLPPGITLTDNGNGTGKLSGTPTAGGVYTIVVTASNFFNGTTHATTQTITFTVTPVPTTLTLTSSANPSTLGQGVTFTAQITPTPGTVTVFFYLDGVNPQFAIADTDASGKATTSVPLTTMGSGFHTITAAWYVTGPYLTSTGSLTQHVNVTSGPASGTSLSATPTTNNIYFDDGRIFSHPATGDVNLNLFNAGGPMAVDPSGNFYFFQGQVDGSQYLARANVGGGVTLLGPALSSPVGLGLDAVGNIYVAQGTSSPVLKIAQNGSSSTILQGENGSGGGVNYNLSGLAVDAAGNVFVSNLGSSANSSQILELSPPYSGSPSVLASSLRGPAALALDALDNLFVADFGGSGVYEISLITGAHTPISGMTAASLAVDPSGTLYIGTAGGTNTLYQLPAPYTATPTSIDTGHTFYGVAVLPQTTVTFGQSVTLQATAVSSPAGAFPAGTVTFKEGATALGANVALNAASIATKTISTLAVGTHQLTATYNGGTAFPASTSAFYTVIVKPISLPVTVSGTRIYGSGTVTYTPVNPTFPSGVTGLTGTLSGCTTSTTPTTAVASYAGTISGCTGLSPVGTNAGNYAVTYVDGGVTVTLQPLPVNVSGSWPNGSPLAFSFAPVSPLPGGITITGTLSGCSSTVPAGSATGTYNGTISGCTGLTLAGATASNYLLTYVDDGVAVFVPQLSITVTGTRPFGGGVSTTFSFVQPTSLPPGLTSVGGTVTCSTTVGQGTPVGPHAGTISGCSGLTLSGPSAIYYAITYVDGGVTVTDRSITLTIRGSQLPGGTPVFGFDQFTNIPSDVAQIYGFVSGCQTSVTASTPAGFYTGTISGCTMVSVYAPDGVRYPVVVVDGGFTVGSGQTSTSLTAGPLTPPDVLVGGSAGKLKRYASPYSAAATTIASIGNIASIAVTSTGSIIVADSGTSQLVVYAADGTLLQSTPMSTVVSAIAVDSHDNLFGITGGTGVVEFAPPYTGAAVPVVSGLLAATSLAFDPADRLFIGTLASNGIYVLMVPAPYTDTPFVVAQDVTSSEIDRSIAVDADENLYMIQGANGPSGAYNVLRIPPPYNAGRSNINPPNSYSMQALAVDRDGDVLIGNGADAFSSSYVRTSTTTTTLPGSNGFDVRAIAATRPDTTVEFGTTVTLTAKVASLAGGQPGGSVTFMDGATELGSAPLAGTPMTATLQTTTLIVGTHHITAIFDASGPYDASTSPAQTVIVTSPPVTITFGPAPALLVGDTGTVTATVSSGSPVTFSTTSPTCAVTADGLVTALGAGACVIAATQPPDVNNIAAPPTSQTLTIGQASQAIIFGTAPSVVVGGSATVGATGGASGNTVIFSTPSIDCSVSSTGLVTGIAAGTGNCTILADQAGNADYTAAPQASLVLDIGKAEQTLTFDPAPTIVVNGTGTVGVASATPNSGMAIELTSTTPGICTISGTTVTGVAAGMCVIAADQAGDGDYNAAAQATLSIEIGKAEQTVAFGTAPAVVVNGTGSLAATSSVPNSGNPIVFGSLTPATCSVAGTTVAGVSAGTCIVTADQAGNADYNPAAQTSQTFSVGKANQNLAFGAAPTVMFNGTGAVSATSAPPNSGNPIAYSSATTGACTVAPDTGLVAGLAVGTNNCTINADQAQSADYNAAPTVSQTFSVVQATQTIVFGAQSPASETYANGGTFAINPLASGGPSGNAVTYSSPSTSVCSVSGTTVTMVGVGTCTLAADQAGNTNYAAATQVTQNVAIGVAAQTIGNFVATPGSPTYAPGGTFTVSADGGSSNNAVTFTIAAATSSVCSISANTVTTLAAGTCSVLADQAGNASYAAASQAQLNVTIAKAPQTITFGTVPTIAVGGNGVAAATMAAPNSGNAIAYVSNTPTICTISVTTVTGVATGTCTIAASVAGDTDYLPGSATQNIGIGIGSQTITFTSTAPGSAAVGGATYAPVATSTAGLTVRLSVDAAASGICSINTGVVSFNATGQCVIDANQAGNENYSAASQMQQSFAVSKAAQTITFGAQPAHVYQSGGTFAIDPLATASSGLAVSYSSLSTAVCTVSDTTVAMLAVGTCTIAADQAGDATTYAAAPTVTRDVTISAAPVRTYTAASPTGTGTITSTFTTADPTCTFGADTAYRSAATAPADAGFAFPQGLANFVITACAPGASITMVITYPQALPAGAVYRKFGATSAETNAHWYGFGAVSGNTATLTLTDGALGDDDLQADGSIADPGGVAVAAAAPVSAVPAPMLSLWGLLLMALTLAGFAPGARRTKF